jgi:hypothetical protein
MAFTVTKGQWSVFGDQRVWQGVITADATTGVVSFGLGSLFHVQATPKSAASGDWNMSINALAAGTASAGDLAISSVASGDDFYVSVYGR